MFLKTLKFVGKSLLYLVVLLTVVVFALVLHSAVIYPMYLESQARIGMDKKEVISNFDGKKYQLSETLPICDSNAWYGDCEGAKNSQSVEYLTVKTGIDTWLVVGFDGAGKVSFVGLGDT